MITFQVQGNPVAQPRPRRSVRGGVYTPAKGIKAWRTRIAIAARQQKIKTIQGPIILNLMFFMPRPKSHFRTGRHAAVLKDSSPLRHIQTPDIDNLAKAVMDALSKAQVWGDDSQVTVLNSAKYWATKREPGVKITITEAT